MFQALRIRCFLPQKWGYFEDPINIYIYIPGIRFILLGGMFCFIREKHLIRLDREALCLLQLPTIDPDLGPFAGS